MHYMGKFKTFIIILVHMLLILTIFYIFLLVDTICYLLIYLHTHKGNEFFMDRKTPNSRCSGGIDTAAIETVKGRKATLYNIGVRRVVTLGKVIIVSDR